MNGNDRNATHISLQDALAEVPTKEVIVADTPVDSDARSERSAGGRSTKVPVTMKLVAVLLVSLIGFGSHWSSGVTGAMKSTLKKVRTHKSTSFPRLITLKELSINNAQYSLLEASQDFMKTALILLTGLLTDRLGGAQCMVWGNIIYSLGSIIIAAATTIRGYNLMIGGMIVQSLGDIATQVAQYRIFSSWFAPSNGFASTLAFELALGKIGSFVGQATANPIAKGTGDFSWVYWTAVFMNLFTNAATILFWFFRKFCDRKFSDLADPATGEKLRENTKKFEFGKLVQLPWPFWGIICFTAFQTSTAVVFSQNATELAEQRFDVSSVKAGWYTATSQYLGFFLVPVLGVFIDLFGHRLSVMFVCGAGVFIAMCLAAFGPDIAGTAAALGVYAFAYSLGPTTIIDGIRTIIWYQDTFGAGYAVKIAVNNSMNIIIRIVTGIIQDKDENSYDHVVIVYVILAAGSVVVSAVLLAWSCFTVDLKRLQWTKKQRMRKGDEINAQREAHKTGSRGEVSRTVNLGFFAALILLILGAWAAYFWGLATGNND